MIYTELMKIVITDRIDISEVAQQQIQAMGGAVHDDVPDEAEVIERVKDAELITANYIDITPKVIDAARRLKYIVVPAVGSEWVDKAYAASKGIVVVNCPTHNAQAVAEHALALMFAVQRRLVEAVADLRDGVWKHQDFKGYEVKGSVIGIVGEGNIGRRLATMCTGLGATVTSLNSRSGTDEWNKVLSSSDVLFACLPLNDRTRHVLNATAFAKMKQGSIFVNVGRGATVDSEALKTALGSGELSGAGLDVFENEPLQGSPDDAIVELARMKNVVATPHMAYNTHETVERLGEEFVSNIRSCILGSPTNVVN